MSTYLRFDIIFYPIIFDLKDGIYFFKPDFVIVFLVIIIIIIVIKIYCIVSVYYIFVARTLSKTMSL